jgi:hypothetical protein
LLTGTTSFPLPVNVPKGVTNTGTIRGSSGGMFGKLAQLLGLVQDDAPPRMRARMPCSSWPTAPPVCTATQSQGCGLDQSVGAVEGHGAPSLIV